MANAIASTSVCSGCGEPLGSKDTCLPCLLRIGLNEGIGSEKSIRDSVFGDFEIERHEDGSLWELGHGAMGITYRASDRVLHRAVALKLIESPSAASDSQTVRERFLREARAAASLRHPNIAGVFHFGTAPESSRCYCAMELVEGETLEALVRRDGPLKLDEALDIATQVTCALMAAAERGLVHRDLKPGNIMLIRGSDPLRLEVKVIDFGLAKAARDVSPEMELTHGGFVGTPAFASPEQFTGGAVDGRSDIYALGVTLWFSLTGRLPFVGSTIEEIRQQQGQHLLPLGQLRARAVPEIVIDLLRSCLALDPNERPASAGQLLRAVESCRNQLAKRGRARKFALMIVGIVILAVATVSILLSRSKDIRADKSIISARRIEKGIAVLPFENLSAEKNDEFLADSVQDDILTSVSKVKNLKVIARTSVMEYGSRPRQPGQIREIGRTLGISHVLEGSVRKIADRLVINVALIDAHDERRVWSERYERTLNDTTSLQGELAVEIARELRASLTPTEATFAATKPTQNSQAYLLYLRAREIDIANGGGEGEMPAIKLYQQAVDLDPRFALARARLSLCASEVYYSDAPDAWKARARTEAEEAVRLRPNLGEAHLALTHCYLWGDGNYDRALAELSRAAELLPNSPEVPVTAAYIYKRQNRLRDRIAALLRAETLDPRNVRALQLLTNTLRWVRDWPEAIESFDRYQAIVPREQACSWRVRRARDEFQLSGDVNALRNFVAREEGPLASSDPVNFTKYEIAMFERNYPEAARSLTAVPAESLRKRSAEAGGHSKAFHEALLAVASNAGSRQQALERARNETERRIWEHSPGSDRPDSDLALLYAFLGRKEDAIRQAEHAVELWSADSIEKNDASAALAMVYAQTGEAEKALDLIEHLLTVPVDLQHEAIYNMTLADLKWRWEWDPLRSNPRFQKLLARPDPKTVY
jgi:serine/threonine protein kinase/tetratricopeptide (TPR) repeat protein